VKSSKYPTELFQNHRLERSRLPATL